MRKEETKILRTSWHWAARRESEGRRESGRGKERGEKETGNNERKRVPQTPRGRGKNDIRERVRGERESR